jgi:hypothetical protein
VTAPTAVAPSKVYCNWTAMAQARASIGALKKAGLSKSCILAYFAIAARINQKTGTAFPSYPTIAQDAGVSLRSAKRAVQALATAGFLRKESKPAAMKRRSNLYTITSQNDTVESINLTPPSCQNDTIHGAKMTPEVENFEIEKVKEKKLSIGKADALQQQEGDEKEKAAGKTNEENLESASNPENALKEIPAAPSAVCQSHSAGGLVSIFTDRARFRNDKSTHVLWRELKALAFGLPTATMTDQQAGQLTALVAKVREIDPTIDPNRLVEWCWARDGGHWWPFTKSASLSTGRTGPGDPDPGFALLHVDILVAHYSQSMARIQTQAVEAAKAAEQKKAHEEQEKIDAPFHALKNAYNALNSLPTVLTYWDVARYSGKSWDWANFKPDLSPESPFMVDWERRETYLAKLVARCSDLTKCLAAAVAADPDLDTSPYDLALSSMEEELAIVSTERAWLKNYVAKQEAVPEVLLVAC